MRIRRWNSEPERQHPIGKHHTASLWRYLPHVIFTTFAVVVLPVFIVTLLRQRGLVDGIAPLLIAGLALSISFSSLGAAIWKTRPGSGDILFGDLIIWGFVRRWLVDRRLSSATKILGQSDEGGEELSPTEKVELLEKLSSALEARDPYTHGHSRRVARHSTTMAKRMGLSREQIAKIRTAAAIHDVGKVDTPRKVLGKEGRLTDDEYEVIKEHPVVGAVMASDLKDPELTEMVRHHHERLDGKGYPDGLSGEGIPLGARIIAVADTFDAITSSRPYRPATAHKKALDVLRSESGSQLDPDAVEAFRSYYSGSRPVAIWAVIANLPQRLFSGIFDELGAGVASASKVMAATTATVVAGAAASQTMGIANPHTGNDSSGGARPALSSTPIPGFPGRTLASTMIKAGSAGGESPAGGPGRKLAPGSGWTANDLGPGPTGSYEHPLTPAAGGHSDSEHATAGAHSEGGAGEVPTASGPSREPAPAADDAPGRSEQPTRGDDDSGSAPVPTNSGNSGGGNSGQGGGNSGSGGSGKGGAPPSGSPGNSGSAPGHGGSSPGNSGSAPGQGGSSPGNSGSAPGQGGSSPGNSGSAPGQGGSSPGNSGSAPGNSGSAPGNSGSAPGNSGSAPGNSGSAPGNSGSSGSSSGSGAPPASSPPPASSAPPGNSGSSGGGPPPGAGPKK